MAEALGKGPRTQSRGKCTGKGCTLGGERGSDKRTQGTQAGNGLTHTPHTFPYVTRLHPALAAAAGSHTEALAVC